MRNSVKRVFKYFFIIIASLLVIIVAGLLMYYSSLYKKVEPPKSAAIQAVAKTAAVHDKPLLLPVPQKVTWTRGSFVPQYGVINTPSQDAKSLDAIWKSRIGDESILSQSGNIQFIKDASLAEQAYRLSIKPQSIKVQYNTLRGAFYALSTLKLIAKQSSQSLPCVEIEDQPDLKTRGAMIDVSRGKVPKLETIYEIVDLLTDLKYNQLQLYIEGFSFGYPSFKRFWEKTETPLMPEEIRELDSYCKARFIDLVPNQNSLGHMQDWLKQDELKDLAECPEGYKLLGLIEMKTTLSPTEPRSLELVKKMSDDLLPNFSSTQYNVNLDEPFELGKSKQRPISDPKEVARLYMDYAHKLNSYVNSKDKTMMMWGDVVSKTPEIVNDIPKNVTLLEWRYEAIQPFDKICQTYQKAGKRYLVCPGTSSWSSFTGRTDNMLNNISNAVESAVKYSADGVLITDWGDSPHLQYLTVSYPGLVFAGALSWNYKSKNEIPLDAYLSEVVFNDSSRKMGNLVMDLGRYNQFEEYPMLAMTTTNLAFRFGMMDPVLANAINRKMQQGFFELGAFDTLTNEKIREMFKNAKPYNSTAILNYMSALESELEKVHLERKDSAQIMDEYRNNIRMVKLATLLKHYIIFHVDQTDDENRSMLLEMKSLCSKTISEHEKLWMQRNKRSGYNGSIENFQKLEKSIDEQLALLSSNAVSRWAKRSVEKMTSAAAALYLK